MGMIDEHWCSKCKKEMNKKKDKYTEVNMINPDKKEANEEGKHTRVFLCSDCLKDEKNTNELIEKLRKHANPNFDCQITCQSTAVCPDFTPGKGHVNCRNIYVLKDRVYCGRRHPGATKLNQDKAMVANEVMKANDAYLKKILFPDKRQKRFIDSLLKTLGVDPTINILDLQKVPDEEIIVDKKLVGKTKGGASEENTVKEESTMLLENELEIEKRQEKSQAQLQQRPKKTKKRTGKKELRNNEVASQSSEFTGNHI